MKRILITGADSYIGTSFEKYINRSYCGEYEIDTIDMIDGTWKQKSFIGYDSVFHVAGIAHSDTSNISDEKKALYYRINADLAEETAAKAKRDGVKQFIYMSSSIVYGDSAPIGKRKMITRGSPLNPSNYYGDSKVQAEIKLAALQDENFNICILRPPMIYGKGSKGNFPTLEKMATCLPFFPKVDNQRSMLYIDNLSEFVRLMVKNSEKGVFWPQNAEYSNTSQLVEMISKANGKKVLLIGGVDWILKLLSYVSGLVNKAFGSFTYDQEISSYHEKYQLYGLVDSINITEGKE